MNTPEENTPVKSISRTAIAAAIGVLFAGILGIHWLPFSPVVSYAIVFVSTSVVYLGIARFLFVTDPPARFVGLAIGLSVLVQASFLNLTPVGSDDVYRYMWDGKVQAAGINPYKYSPHDPGIDSLHSALIPSSVNHPDMKSVYFPLSQWMFNLGYALGGENLWGYKLLLLLSQIAALGILALLVRQLKIPLKYLLLYALCPLVILQFGLDAHIDVVGFPLLLMGLLLYVQSRKAFSYILLALSMSIKPVALLLLPILFVRETGKLEKAKIVGVPALAIGIQFLPYVFSTNPFEGLMTFARHWTFNGIVFETLDFFIQNNQISRLVCAALLVGSLLYVIMLKRNLFETFYLSVLLLLLFSPVVHPWYIAWLTLLLPLMPRASGIFYSASASLTAYTIVQYKLHGVWEQAPLILAIEYFPVVILLVRELRRPDNRSQLIGA